VTTYIHWHNNTGTHLYEHVCWFVSLFQTTGNRYSL